MPNRSADHIQTDQIKSSLHSLRKNLDAAYAPRAKNLFTFFEQAQRHLTGPARDIAAACKLFMRAIKTSDPIEQTMSQAAIAHLKVRGMIVVEKELYVEFEDRSRLPVRSDDKNIVPVSSNQPKISG